MEEVNEMILIPGSDAVLVVICCSTSWRHMVALIMSKQSFDPTTTTFNSNVETFLEDFFLNFEAKTLE